MSNAVETVFNNPVFSEMILSFIMMLLVKTMKKAEKLHSKKKAIANRFK
ncbi:hypothetical protein vBSeyj11_4 [Salmonella phage vB Seyj1-1]|uniref:Uncharacterized protein n=1 Tax=Salmonella phage vB Seyj1-1 TaxID=2801511 RepID=A0A7U0G9E4_9CAUD|nr:hypothetical protein vBSeyj11_4 [Salmonella phage vB Seyj1-1]